jgi:acyl-coenzyme A synthetase/AMP-(fatty) acid ligase
MLISSNTAFAKNRYPDLRYVSIIGEAFQEDRFKELRRILEGTQFHMMYGTTEAFRSTCLLPEELDLRPDSVGRALPGVEILIVDEGRVCGPGEVGEIVHRGAFVSPGYWNNPEKTNAVFKDGHVYTGDLGKMDDEGYVYFVGRKDGLIKTNGFRVSPEEIEECLYRIEGVKEAAVVPMKDEVFGYAIKAVIACDAGSGVDAAQVTAHCRKVLPHYMVPAAVDFRPELPKTGTGKINRSELREDR